MKTSWSLTLMLVWLLADIAGAFGIYGHGLTSEDTLSISVHLTDSLGNPSGTRADSFFVSILGPSGDSITTLAGKAGDAGLTVDSLNTRLAGWTYVYRAAIADIDGSGRAGTYELTFCAKDNGPEYVNCVRDKFQLTEHNLATQLAAVSTILDSLMAVLDTLQNQDNWVSSFDQGSDMVSADVIQLSGDGSAADNLESMLDNTGGGRLTLGSVAIHSSANDTAMVVRANPTGTGIGLFINGGGNGGEGVKIVGGSTKSALVAQAGTSATPHHGFDLIGDGGGFGLNGSLSDAVCGDLADAIWDEDTAGHGLPASFAYMLKDTSAYQGSASGLTAANVADAVWDEMQSGHITPGSFGAYLDAPISDVGSPAGNGIFPVTVTVIDSQYNQTIPGARVAVHNANLTALIGLNSTASNGATAFNLDPDDFVLSAFAPGYQFSARDTITVTGAQCDTVFGYRFDPGTPASPDLCRIYGFIYGIDGLPVEDVQVTARIDGSMVRYGSLLISPNRTTAVTDSIGYFYIDLIPSAKLNPSGIPYIISADYSAGVVLKKKLEIPETTLWQITW